MFKWLHKKMNPHADQKRIIKSFRLDLIIEPNEEIEFQTEEQVRERLEEYSVDILELILDYSQNRKAQYRVIPLECEWKDKKGEKTND